MWTIALCHCCITNTMILKNAKPVSTGSHTRPSGAAISGAVVRLTSIGTFQASHNCVVSLKKSLEMSYCCSAITSTSY